MHRDTNPRIVELKAAKLKHANDVDLIMNIFGWSSFQLTRSDKYLTKSLKHWVKQPQRLCITKRGRPTLPSLTRLARPPAPTTPAIPESATDATPRPTSGLTSRLSGLTSRFSIETSRAIRNYPDLVLSTSDRFRTVQRHLRTVPNGSEALSVGLRVVFTSGLRAGSGLLGPLGVFCRGTGFRSPKFGWWVTDWCNQVTTSNFLTNSPDQKFVWICKKVMLLWGNFV